ncbi:MAG: hypothetical protein C0468_06660 [Planctomyces sp.]|nr:hypothetical protein [Planctomyces sp.]MBA4120827.1 hypothetical protein [Isosphaera sp.]
MTRATLGSVPRLVLMGLRCAGKSTVARLLAERTGLGWEDLDDRTAQLMGVPSAGEGIVRQGLAAFRDAESRSLRQALEGPGGAAIVALGGGTPTAPGAAGLLRSARAAQGPGRAVVVYLHAPAWVLAARMRAGGAAGRPALLNDPGRSAADEVSQLYEQRDGLYRELADAVVEVGDAQQGRILSAVTAAWGIG